MSLAFTYTQSRLNKMSQLCQECKLEQTGEKHTADSFLTASRSSYAQAVRLAREEKSQHVTSSVELRQPRISSWKFEKCGYGKVGYGLSYVRRL